MSDLLWVFSIFEGMISGITDPAFTKIYNQYRSTIEAMPLLKEFGSTNYLLLEYGQVEPQQRMQVRAFKKAGVTP